jgi:CBS domain-containing protein
MKEIKAKDVMNRDVIFVRESMSVVELVRLFEEKGISGAPVVDEAGLPVGVVSITDVARGEVEGGEQSTEDESHHFYQETRGRINPEDVVQFHTVDDALRVENIMTPLVLDVSPDTSVQEIARMMVKGHIHRILVTDKNRIIGIISTIDLVKLLQG